MQPKVQVGRGSTLAPLLIYMFNHFFDLSTLIASFYIHQMSSLISLSRSFQNQVCFILLNLLYKYRDICTFRGLKSRYRYRSIFFSNNIINIGNIGHIDNISPHIGRIIWLYRIEYLKTPVRYCRYMSESIDIWSNILEKKRDVTL